MCPSQIAARASQLDEGRGQAPFRVFVPLAGRRDRIGPMNPAELIAKWRPVGLRERQACHEHFFDLCGLVGHPGVAAADSFVERLCFDGGVPGWGRP
jgi:hypothetical protein